VTDIDEFLRARYAEDRQVALDAAGDSPTWTAESSHHRITGEDTGAEVHPVVEREGNGDGGCETVHARHIARHDPASVLADIDAKLRILDEHGDINDGDCSTCVTGRWGYPVLGGSTPQLLPCRTLRLLALPFASHQDYLEEWRP
jgi:hypothetical protein